MGIFRIDPLNGADNNNGNSIYFPWKTTAPLNAAIASGRIGRGDVVVLANRGDTPIFGNINAATSPAPQGIAAGGAVTRAATRLLFDAWGDTAPILDLYKIANSIPAWTPHAAGVWKCNITAGAAGITGNAQEVSTNVGHLVIDGELKGHRSIYSSFDLAAQPLWSYASDNTHVYVRADANPASVAEDIRIAVDTVGITPGIHTTFSNLEVHGAGGHGVNSIAQGLWSVLGLKLKNIGGSMLDPGTRYGNGVQAYVSGNDILVEGNVGEDIFDTFWTAQGASYVGGANGWTDIEVRGNTITRAAQAFEHWFDDKGGSLLGYQRVNIHDNIVNQIGYNWGEDYKSAGILTYEFDDVPGGHDLNIFDNTFLGGTRYRFHRRSNNTDFSTPPGLNVHNNVVVLAPGTPIAYQQLATIEDANEWAVEEGTDKGTDFFVMPDNLEGVPAKDYVEAVQVFLAAQIGSNKKRAAAVERVLGATAARTASLEAQIASLRPEGSSAGSLIGNQWYLPYASGRSTVSTADATNRFRGLEWVVPAGGWIDQAMFSVTVAGSAGAAFHVVVMSLQANKLVPRFISAAVDCASSGDKLVPAGFRVREGERLYVGGLMQATPGTLPTIRSGTNAGRSPFVGIRASDISGLIASAQYTSGIQLGAFTVPPNGAILTAGGYAPEGTTDNVPLVALHAIS